MYDNKLTMYHYASLAGKEVELEVVRSLVENNNTLTFDGSNAMTYIGPRVLSRYYRLQLIGIPSDTILNPIQRDYIARVTLDFLRDNSDTVPNTVEVISQDFSRRELLRDGRQLQAGLVTAESYIYGLGDDAQAFYEPIEAAFRSNEERYRTLLIREQYRPGSINDGEDFGAAFKDLLRISVKTNETVSGSTTTASADNTDTTGVIVCSILIALSMLWLIYRVIRDFFMEQDGHGIKKEKVGERKDQGKAEGGGNYLYGARDEGDRANQQKPQGARQNGPPGKKKKKPPAGQPPLNAGSGHSGGGKPPPKKRPPGARPNSKSPTRPNNNNGPDSRKKPVKKKRPPNPNAQVV